MKNNNWTPEEIAYLRNPDWTDGQVAVFTGRSEAAIRGKRQRLGIVKAKTETPKAPTTFEQDDERHAADYWRREYKTLELKYEKALRTKSVSDRLVEKAVELAPKAYSNRPPFTMVSRSSGGTAQSAVLLLTDCHVGLVVKPEQTLGFGGYDFATFLARLKFLEEAVVSILRDHTNTPVPELVLCLGGDMLDGALNHSAEAAQKNTVFNQFYGAGHALSQFIRNVAAHVPKIRVYCTQGNHTRFQNQHRMPTNNRFSNFDSFLYAYMQALTRELTNVYWTFDQQPVALFDVQGFLFQLFHGD